MCNGHGKSRITDQHSSKATVEEVANTTVMMEKSSTANIDESILLKMKKCLDRAKHPNTPEREAEAALLMLSRYMAKYNITQAEVLAREPQEKHQTFTGHSVVSLRHRDQYSNKQVQHSVYLGTLCRAMGRFFQAKFFVTSCTNRREVTFYGIAGNTVTAAHAFEMVYNLMSHWALRFDGRSEQNSYCLGLCRELRRTAEREQEDEERRAKENEENATAARVREEERQRQAELERLARQPTVEEDTGWPAADQGVKQEAEEEDATEMHHHETSDTDQHRPANVHVKTEGLDSDDSKSEIIEQGPLIGGSARPRLFVFSPHSNGVEDNDYNGTIEDDDGAQDDHSVSYDDGDTEGDFVFASRTDFDNEVIDLTLDADEAIDLLVRTAVDGSRGVVDLTMDSDDEMVKAEPADDDHFPKGIKSEFHDDIEDEKGGVKVEPVDPVPSIIQEPSAEPEPQAEDQQLLQREWKSLMQLVLFRNTAMSVAKEYRKSRGIKLRTGRKRKAGLMHDKIYKEGERDSKKIDVRRRAIAEFAHSQD